VCNSEVSIVAQASLPDSSNDVINDRQGCLSHQFVVCMVAEVLEVTIMKKKMLNPRCLREPQATINIVFVFTLKGCKQ